MHIKQLIRPILMAAGFLISTAALHASEADLKIPPLDAVKFDGLGGVSGARADVFRHRDVRHRRVFGLVQYKQTKALPVHDSMADVSHTIWETCKTYLFQQGKFLAILWVLIAGCMVFYFKVLRGQKSAATSPSFSSPRFWASSAATAWPGSASASTPSPTRAPPSPR